MSIELLHMTAVLVELLHDPRNVELVAEEILVAKESFDR